MAVGRFVAYYRVSTDRQGRSGLGLEAQREAVQSYLDGGSWTLADEVTEVESGKRNDRPELDRALGLCRLYGATLVVAKLDRLARNVAFISKLMESGVDFVAVDFPQANRLTIHILAAVAEHEREMISSPHEGGPGCCQGARRQAGHSGQPVQPARRQRQGQRREGGQGGQAGGRPAPAHPADEGGRRVAAPDRRRAEPLRRPGPARRGLERRRRQADPGPAGLALSPRL